MASFPLAGKRFGILTTGCVTNAPKRNTRGDTGCVDNGVAYRGTRDTTVLQINMKVPQNTSCLSFRFRFLSEEFPEFRHSDFNDGFIAELNRTTWNASGETHPQIHAPLNFATSRSGSYVSVNDTSPELVSRSRARGTTYDAATAVLRASTPIKPGIHRLFLTIFDQRDRLYDSAVFIDNLRLDRRSPCKSGVAHVK
jgi:hypothetical protein